MTQVTDENMSGSMQLWDNDVQNCGEVLFCWKAYVLLSQASELYVVW